MKQQHFIERIAGAMGQEVNWDLESQFMILQFPKWVCALNMAYDRVWRAWPWGFIRKREVNYTLVDGVVPWAKLAGGHWVQCSVPADGSGCQRVLGVREGALGFEVLTKEAKVLLQYVTAPPVFSDNIWKSDSTYNAGDVVYNHTRGDSFKALVNSPGTDFTDAGKWERFDVVDQLLDVVGYFTKSNYLVSEGEHEAGGYELRKAEAALDDALLRSRQPKVVF